MKKIIALALTVLLLATTVFAGAADRLSTTITTAVIENTEGSLAVNSDDVYARIGGMNIQKDLFNYISYEVLAQLGSSMAIQSATDAEKLLAQDLGNGKTIKEYIVDSAVDFFAQYVTIIRLAKELGIQPDEESKKYLEDIKENIIMQLGGEAAYKAYLSDMEISEESLLQVEEWAYIAEQYVVKATEKGSVAYVGEDEAKKAFMEEYFKIKLILITGSPTFDAEGNLTEGKSEEELQNLSAEIIAKLDSGENFEKLREEFNDDTGVDPDEFYIFKEGEFDQLITEATKKLNPGEYTKTPVVGDYGYVIVKRYESNPEKLELANITQRLSEEKLVEIITERKEKLRIRLNDKEIEKALKNLVETRFMNQ